MQKLEVSSRAFTSRDWHHFSTLFCGSMDGMEGDGENVQDGGRKL